MAPINNKILFRSVLCAIHDQQEKNGSTSSEIISHLKSSGKQPLPKKNLRFHVTRSLDEGVDAGVLMKRNKRFMINFPSFTQKIKMDVKKRRTPSRRVINAGKFDHASLKIKERARRGPRESRHLGRHSSLEDKLLSPLRIRSRKEQQMRKPNKITDASLATRSRPTPKGNKRRLKKDVLDKFLDDLVAKSSSRAKGRGVQEKIGSETSEWSGTAGSAASSRNVQDFDEEYDEDAVMDGQEGGEDGEYQDADGGEGEGDDDKKSCKKDETGSEREESEKREDEDDGEDGEGEGEEDVTKQDGQDEEDEYYSPEDGTDNLLF